MIESTAVFPVEWRTVSVDDRIVAGIAVPWNETSYLVPDPGGERFLPGSLTRTVRQRGDRLKLFRAAGDEHQHAVAIARPVELDPRHPDGLFIRWRIAKTPPGDAALTEVAEGMLDAFSVGFRAIRTQRATDGVREVVEAELGEVTLAPLGAYAGAVVTETRTPADVTTVDDIERWFAEHPLPAVNRAPLPDLRRAGRRG
jgi:HK97 family phage prohead protease